MLGIFGVFCLFPGFVGGAGAVSKILATNFSKIDLGLVVFLRTGLFA